MSCERWVFIKKGLEGRGRGRTTVLLFAMIPYDWSYRLSEVRTRDGILVDLFSVVAQSHYLSSRPVHGV